MKHAFLLFLTMFIGLSLTLAQEKRTVAIMPFMYSKENEATAKQIQEMVVSLLSQRTDITVVDRSKDSMVIAELGHTIRDVSVYAKEIKFGNITTAPEIIVGYLSKATADPVTSSGNSTSGTRMKYSGVLSFSLQLINLETGTIKQQETFTGKTKEGDVVNRASQVVENIFRRRGSANTVTDAAGSAVMADTKEQAIQAAIANSEKAVLQWINQQLSTNIKIIGIQDRDDNLPQTVLVTGLGNSIRIGTPITINEIKYLDGSDGSKVKQVIKIGVLKVKELQGEVTLCKVTDGRNGLEEKMKASNLELVINK
jgi:hypothetical protein